MREQNIGLETVGLVQFQSWNSYHHWLDVLKIFRRQRPAAQMFRAPDVLRWSKRFENVTMESVNLVDILIESSQCKNCLFPDLSQLRNVPYRHPTDNRGRLVTRSFWRLLCFCSRNFLGAIQSLWLLICSVPLANETWSSELGLGQTWRILERRVGHGKYNLHLTGTWCIMFLPFLSRQREN